MKVFICDLYRDIINEAIEIVKWWSTEKFELISCPIKGKTELSERLARIKVLDPLKKELNPDPLPMEIAYEKRRLTECLCAKGIVYDGIEYVSVIRDAIGGGIKWLSEKPIYITAEFLATFDNEDLKYHLRYAIFSFPVIISLNGIIDAPARSREYYIAQKLKLNPQHFTDDCLISINDERFPRILAGIILQALFFYKTGYPFCEDIHCSLYNAHWQKELLISQSDEPYVLCSRHRKLLEELE